MNKFLPKLAEAKNIVFDAALHFGLATFIMGIVGLIYFIFYYICNG